MQLPTICTALAGDAMFQTAHNLSGEFPFFEFRLDSWKNPEKAVEDLRAFLQEHTGVTAIATCRRKENGGTFLGDAEDEARLLRQAHHAGARIVDLSLESAEELHTFRPALLEELQSSGAVLMLSWHDFEGTPDLHAVYERIRKLHAGLCKIVPTARSLRDSFGLMDLLQRHGGDGTLVAMSMGMPGVLTRILGPRYGSRFTFGSAEQGSETAPGQIGSRTLRDLYRVDVIDAATRVFGVFGRPIGGSKSPVMLNTAFRERTQNAVYLPFETESAEELFECFERLSLAGASVTMPLKEQIVPRLDRSSDLARQLGAANTLVRAPHGAAGHNTDVAGILQPLQKRMELEGARILVLGAGGAARAAVYALRSRGAHVSICNRTHGKAEELARLTDSVALRSETLADMTFDAIVNATPYGMANQQIEAPLQAEQMNCRVFFDMVYNPVKTPLIQLARAKGAEVIPGIEMFVTQGAAQFELWTGEPAPVSAMRDAVLQSLKLPV